MLAARAVVGAGDDDHGGLRGHGAQDLPGHVRGGAVCPGRRPHRRPTSPRHRLQLRDVLLTHSGLLAPGYWVFNWGQRNFASVFTIFSTARPGRNSRRSGGGL